MHLVATDQKLDPAVVRCVVADPHPAIVEFLRVYLASERIRVTATAAGGDEALAKVERQQPDVAIVALRMPGLDGIELARRIKRVSPQTAVLIYTGYGDRAALADALDAGVRGFVQKDAPPTDLRRAIEAVAAGGTYVDPLLAGSVAARNPPSLSDRERDVLRLLAEGGSNEQIGRLLHISPGTVRAHLVNARAKLGAATRTEAVARALRLELIR
jgi:DNA-binding NarL/FixJ family response regulator